MPLRGPDFVCNDFYLDEAVPWGDRNLDGLEHEELCIKAQLHVLGQRRLRSNLCCRGARTSVSNRAVALYSLMKCFSNRSFDRSAATGRIELLVKRLRCEIPSLAFVSSFEIN
jgi:hypothetical protein